MPPLLPELIALRETPLGTTAAADGSRVRLEALALRDKDEDLDEKIVAHR